jgi:hypothetical protein
MLNCIATLCIFLHVRTNQPPQTHVIIDACFKVQFSIGHVFNLQSVMCLGGLFIPLCYFSVSVKTVL